MNQDDNDNQQGMGGRPTLFTNERAERIIEGVKQGLTYKLAAAYAGVSYSTLNRWRSKGRSEDGPAEFRQFWNDMEEANGEAALHFLSCINQAAESGNWKAASWILERRFPSQWGRNSSDSDPSEPIFPF